MFHSVCQHDGGNIYDVCAGTFAERALSPALRVGVAGYCLGDNEAKETVSAPAPPVSFSNEVSPSQWESPTLSFLRRCRVEKALEPLVEATCSGKGVKAAANAI